MHTLIGLALCAVIAALTLGSAAIVAAIANGDRRRPPQPPTVTRHEADEGLRRLLQERASEEGF